MKKILFLLDKDDRKALIKILIFSIFISLLEVVGVGIIMPFVNVASNFDLIESNHYYQKVFHFFSFESSISFVMAFGLFLVLFYLFRSSMSLLYFQKLSLFAQGRYRIFANRLFVKYLHLDYLTFLQKNSSHLVKAIINEAQNLSLFLSNMLFLISEGIVALFIYILLLFVNWKVTLLVTLFLGINIFFLLKVISPKIKKAGEKRDLYQKSFYELLGAVFGNFKILKLQSDKTEIQDEFEDATSHFAQVNVAHSTLSQVPRLYLEAIGFSLIALIILIVIWVTQSDIASSLSLITFFLLGLFRLIPSANRILSSYNNMLFYAKSVDIIFEDLHLPQERLRENNIVFQKNISMRDLSFKYEDTYILKELALTIAKGDKIAFIGESGSGKSTLVDIIMGLYPLEKGEIYIDDVKLSWETMLSWRSKIGYIPQTIYLFDDTVAVNVAMEIEYDAERVIKVLKQAQIWDLLIQNHQGLKTQVGEGGTKLSGGQRQRIAIARALYHNPEILILDEATSALDEATEREIMQTIYMLSKEKTLIIIAHRLSTIQGCNKVFKIHKGKVCEVENS